MCRLVRVGREEPPALEAAYEPDVDRWPFGLESPAGGGRLPKRAADQFPVSVEYEDVGREWVVRGELATRLQCLVVAYTGQTMPGLQHVYLEAIRVAAERDPRRGVQADRENRGRKPRGKNNVWRQGGIEKGCVVSTLRRRRRVRYDRRL